MKYIHEEEHIHILHKGPCWIVSWKVDNVPRQDTFHSRKATLSWVKALLTVQGD